MSGLNDRRVLLGPVSLDAWFVESKGGFKLHAHLNFGEHRFGGETEAPVRFKLKIRNAELVAVVPETEPVSCDKSTVYRGTKSSVIRYQEEESSNAQNQKKGRVRIGPAGASVDGTTAIKRGEGRKRKTAGSVKSISVSQRLDELQNSVWEMSGAKSAGMIGSPWDCNDRPLLTLKDKRTVKKDGMEPQIRLEVYCYRENLEISEIEIKSDDAKPFFDSKSKQDRRRLAAAESYIRSKLMELQLGEFKENEVSEPFKRLCLALVPVVVKGQ
jgi:hypothetical protein